MALKPQSLVCSSLVLSPHQISIILLLFSPRPPCLLRVWETGHGGGTRRVDSSLPVKLADYVQRPPVIFPLPFLYLSTFSWGGPSASYLTTATLRYHNDSLHKRCSLWDFAAVSVRRCRPTFAHVTVGAFMINSGRRVGGQVTGVNVREAREGREKKMCNS